MPKNTQMHMQWITVNGQSVPLVLPQYWDGEKWVISSEQNPLPVKAELTGSNAVLNTRVLGNNIVQTVFSRRILKDRFNNFFLNTPEIPIKGAIFNLRVYGVTGTFAENEGYKLTIVKQLEGTTLQAYDIENEPALFQTNVGNYSGAIITVAPGLTELTKGNFKQYQNVPDYPYPNVRFRVDILGTFAENEGVDCEGVVIWLTEGVSSLV